MINNKVVFKKKFLSVFFTLLILGVIVGSWNNYFSGILIGTFGTETNGIVVGYTQSYTTAKGGKKVYNYTPIINATIGGSNILLTQSPITYESKIYKIGQKISISYKYKNKFIFVIKGLFYFENKLLSLLGTFTGIILFMILGGIKVEFETINNIKKIKRDLLNIILYSLIPLILWGGGLLYKVLKILYYQKISDTLITPIIINSTVLEEVFYIFVIILYLKIFIDFFIIKKSTKITFIIAIILIIFLYNPLTYLLIHTF